MNTLQASRVVRTPLSNLPVMESFRAFDRVKQWVAGWTGARAPTGESNFGGLGWCDSTEQQFIAGIATCRRSVF